MREPSDQSLYEKITEGTGAIVEVCGAAVLFVLITAVIAFPFEMAWRWLGGSGTIWVLVFFNVSAAWVTYRYWHQLLS